MIKANAWVIRGGRRGKREQWALTNDCSSGGRRAAPKLTACVSREDIDLPRATIRHDLLLTLNRPMSVFAASNNDAAARLEQLLQRGTDPG